MDVQDLIDDVDKLSTVEGESEILIEADKVLQTYDNTEQTVRLKINLGVPIFKFRIGKIKFEPEARIGVGFGANVGIQSDLVEVDDLVDFLPEEIPDAMKDKIKDLDSVDLAGNDIVQVLIDSGTLTPEEEIFAQEYLGKYIAPDELGLNIKVPNMFLYTKLDAKVGMLLKYSRKRYFGYINLYGLHRTDFFLRLTKESLSESEGLLDGAKNLNSQIFAMLDYKIGYRTKRFTSYIVFEELKIARLSDNLSEGGDLRYGTDPLIRLHSDYTFRLSIFSLTPFIGVHKRANYGIADGFYAGAAFAGHLWGDRLRSQLRVMVDNEHITISPRAKLWLMQFEYSLKLPIKSDNDGMDVSTLHSFNLRAFF